MHQLTKFHTFVRKKQKCDSNIFTFLHDSLLVRAPDSWSKSCEFESRQERRENFFLQSDLCVLTFSGVRSTPMLPQWHVKDPSHSAKSAGGRLHLNTRTPLTQRCQSGLTMPLSRHRVGTYQKMNSHATRQGTYQETNSHATRRGILGHSRLSSLSHCGLILA